MVRWYHAIFSAYGFWLPNDPRGSWSEFVASYELYRFGPATKTSERRSLAHDPHDTDLRRQAKLVLKYPPVRFSNDHRTAIAHGISKACSESSIVIHACAIGFDHAHVVIRRHARTIESLIGQLKTRSHQQMKSMGCHPFAHVAALNETPPTPWSGGCWKVYINDEQQVRNAIRYVERHPMKEGLAPQRFDFIRPL